MKDPPLFRKLLIANRGEIAIRIARACAEAGVASLAVAPRDDARALHMTKADAAATLPGEGAAAYLDGAALVRMAVEHGCDAVHPGYGFLSENADFARQCAAAGLTFIGPRPEALELFGDKARAVALARETGVLVARNTNGPASLAQVQAFMERLGPDAAGVMLKAVAGGGGRGMRVVRNIADLAEACDRCASEARAAFGSDDIYAEELIGRARHIEVQVVGDRTGAVSHLWERECSVQRRHQKLVEIAPSPWLENDLRQRLCEEATRIAAAARYDAVGTVEFLVETDARGRATGRYVFIEMNPRLQVEHTVTEEVTGVDLVQTQLALAAGRTLAELGLTTPPPARGHAIQLRVNMETLTEDGGALPSGGVISMFEPPSGAGVRVESFGYRGYETHSGFDALLAKLVVHAPSGDFGQTLARARRALGEFGVAGVATTIPALQAILAHPEFVAGQADTGFISRAAPQLVAAAGDQKSWLAPRVDVGDSVGTQAVTGDLEGATALRAPMRGRLVAVKAAAGDSVAAGQTLAIVEAMKMEHAITAATAGQVARIDAAPGDTLRADAPILWIVGADGPVVEVEQTPEHDAEALALRDLIEDARAATLDAARPGAVARLRERDRLTARQRIDLLVDAGSFVEIGGLVAHEGLEETAPAEGVVVGSARIDGRPVMVVSQDFSVFGGSVGHLGIGKMDRAIAIALKSGVPLVMLLDGGGHRIQDGQNSRHYAAGASSFHDLTRLNGWVPVVGAILGAGFAANTNYTGLADFVVMVRGKSAMGLAGPALVKAGTGEDIGIEALGGADAQVGRHGLADLAVATEEEAIAALRRHLSYMPSNARAPLPLTPPTLSAAEEVERAAPLAAMVPANPRKAYDVRCVIDRIADAGSVTEFKPAFARNVVTALARMDGRPVGFIANQALVLGGMLDSPACEKAARFIAMCDAFGLPLIYLIDVPGFAIGSDAERTQLGRRSAKLIAELGLATVPRISVVLRKGYGLGYVAMAGGRSFDADLAVAWPTAEICAMSIEGAVDVAFRKEYAAAADPQARRQQLIDDMRAQVTPLEAARGFGVDDVIDPCATRFRIIETLQRVPARRDNHAPPRFRTIPPV